MKFREKFLEKFPTLSYEEQISEYQAFKKLGADAPLLETDFSLMETIINNRNAEISVTCKDGVCQLNEVNESDDKIVESVEIVETPIIESEEIAEDQEKQQEAEITENELISTSEESNDSTACEEVQEPEEN